MMRLMLTIWLAILEKQGLSHPNKQKRLSGTPTGTKGLRMMLGMDSSFSTLIVHEAEVILCKHCTQQPRLRYKNKCGGLLEFVREDFAWEVEFNRSFKSRRRDGRTIGRGGFNLQEDERVVAGGDVGGGIDAGAGACCDLWWCARG